MRLLYLSTDPGVPVLGHKGASVHVRAMVAAFAAEGVEVVVASPRLAFEGERLTAPAELVEIAPVLPKSYGDERALAAAIDAQGLAVTSLAVELGVDAIYERLALYSAAGVQSAEALGLPHVLEVNAPLSVEAERYRSLPHARLATSLERSVLDSTGRIFAVSAMLAALLAARGVDPRRIEVVPNGVDIDALRSVMPRRGARFTVGFAGSLKPWHGIDVLLDGFARALRAEPGLLLEVVGHGPLAAAVESSGLPAEALRYRGRLSHRETIEAMAGWDIGAAPYPPLDDFWFSPLKVGEYMACGACPVVSDLPQLRDLVGGGERGVLVAPGDPAALAEALVSLTRDRLRARALGARARAFALATLGWERNARTALSRLGSQRREPESLGG